MDFPEMNSLARLLLSAPGSWGVAGGWAVDIHLDVSTRSHDDVDVLVLDRDLDQFAKAIRDEIALFGERPETGERFEWVPGQPLTPGVEALAAFASLGARTQKIQFLVARTDEDEWVYHRGRGTLRLPLTELFLRQGDLRYVTPRVVLLFKSRQMRLKDDADFQAIHESLSMTDRRWLLDRVRAWRDDHPWIERLTELSRDGA